MATDVIMPSLGFDMTAGKLARWLKQEGDQVKKGEPIAEVETEKATVEIEAFAPGSLRKILVPAGETVPVGTAIGIIAGPGEKQETTTRSPTPPEPEAQVVQAQKRATGPIVEDYGRVKASPLARKMAREAGLDLAQIKGSGPGGRIMERDIEAAIRISLPSLPPAPQAVRQEPPPAGLPEPVGVAAQEVPLSRMRQTIAHRMTMSKQTAPHFYVTVEVNMTEAMRMREQLNNLAGPVEKLSVNDIVIAAAARTLVQFPNLNSSYRDGKLVTHSTVNLGIAIAVEDGLLTLTLPDADKKGLREIAPETKAMGERARSNKLRPEDLTPSTFTISNLGMFGVDEFIAIINPPEAAILAVGAATERPIVVEDEIKIAPTMKATLSVDHRVADGAQAAKYFQKLKELLENPMNLLL